MLRYILGSAIAVITKCPVTFGIFILFSLTTVEVILFPFIVTVILLKVYPLLAIILVLYDVPLVTLLDVLLLLQLVKLFVIVYLTSSGSGVIPLPPFILHIIEFSLLILISNTAKLLLSNWTSLTSVPCENCTVKSFTLNIFKVIFFPSSSLGIFIVQFEYKVTSCIGVLFKVTSLLVTTNVSLHVLAIIVGISGFVLGGVFG